MEALVSEYLIRCVNTELPHGHVLSAQVQRLAVVTMSPAEL